MSKQTILVVDDERDILDLIEYNLKIEGFNVLKAENGQEGITKAKGGRPDLILLDIMMPKMDGIEAVEVMRRDKDLKKTPIIFLTAKSDERTEIECLNKGGDDYITKPFSLSELNARIKAVLYRTKANAVTEELPGFQFLSDEKKVIVQGNIISLTKSEFKLLEYLYNNRHKVCSRAEIIMHCWEKDVYDRVVDVNISRMRKKFEICGGQNIIINIPGFGYRFSKENLPLS